MVRKQRSFKKLSNRQDAETKPPLHRGGFFVIQRDVVLTGVQFPPPVARVVRTNSHFPRTVVCRGCANPGEAMTKHYVDQDLTVTTTIRDSNGDLADPTTVTFKWRIGRDGTENTGTVVNPSTGVYNCTLTPDKPGVLYGTWESTGSPDIARPHVEQIHDKRGVQG